jgi:PTS system ascorbate-specific IIA component
MLLELLNENSIQIAKTAADAEEAIRMAGGILVNQEKVKPEYVDAMVDMSKQIPGYIVLAPGLAMPHARPEAGVKELGMSLVTLTNPIEFGNSQNDPVNVVIALAAVDSTQHIGLLQEFSQVFESETIVGRIAACTSVDDVVAILKESV